MILLPPELIDINPSRIREIDKKFRLIYRTITFCRRSSSKDLLDNFINSINDLTKLLSIKNTQMEV